MSQVRPPPPDVRREVVLSSLWPYQEDARTREGILMTHVCSGCGTKLRRPAFKDHRGNWNPSRSWFAAQCPNPDCPYKKERK